MAKNRTLLVTGASGRLGRRVVELLADSRADRLVATTRNPDRLADLAKRGVIVRRADFDDPKSLQAAFAGADRLLLVSTDAIDAPGRRIEQHRAAIDAARAVGAGHVIYTSFAEPDPRFMVAADHWATERALAASGLGWTALRHNLYTEYLAQVLPEAIASGRLVAAAGEGGAAFVTREDCARAAAAALSSTDTGDRVLEIAGPAIVTVRDVARLASELAGRPVSYVPVEPAALKAGLVAAGLRGHVADVLVSMHVAMAQGKFRAATSAVADLTGRVPMSVAAFLSSKSDLLPAAAAAR
ncbi:MAG: NAD(P)-dependent oxidoreductase [Acidobacteria bacterium]|nr:MAG: NAD(P)-dependent oxidoreductase [Acidobacteriota bacterium]